MKSERELRLRQRMQAAVEDLQGLLKQRYPEVTSVVRRRPEDSRSVHLRATVDVPDTTAVVDIVLNRVLEYQFDCGLPIHVIPVQSPERVAAALRAEQAQPSTAQVTEGS